MSRTHHHGSWKPWVKRPPGADFVSAAPSRWTNTFMTRPKRRRDDFKLKKIYNQSVDSDAVAWELGSRKPHIYYW